MSYRELPDAPESAKYRGGYDPADPPHEDDGMMACDCGHRDFEEEVSEIDGKLVCVNCATEAKPCLLCGNLTTGSVGAAGIRWAQVCQKCKNSEDSALREQIRTQTFDFVHEKLFGESK